MHTRNSLFRFKKITRSYDRCEEIVVRCLNETETIIQSIVWDEMSKSMLCLTLEVIDAYPTLSLDSENKL